MSQSAQQKPKICIPIDSAIILRNIGIIPKSVIEGLSEKFHIILLVPDTAIPAVEQLFEKYGAEVRAVESARKLGFWGKVADFIIGHLLVTGSTRVLALYGVRNDEMRFSLSDRCIYALKWCISRTLGKIRFVRVTLGGWVALRLYGRPEVGALLDELQPKLIFLPNTQSILNLDFIAEARKRNIHTVGMPGSWDHLPKKYVPLRPDELLVQNEITRDEAIQYQDFALESITVVGFPYFDIFTLTDQIEEREVFLSKLGFDAKKPMIVFVSSAGYAPDEGECVDMITKKMESHTFSVSPQLYIRTYPGVVDVEHTKFDFAEGKEDVYIEWVDPNRQFHDPWFPRQADIMYFLNLIYHADVVINTVSSIALEASALLRPLINIRFDGYTKKEYHSSIKRFENLSHYQHVYASEGGILVEFEEELITAVETLLSDPTYNRENLTKLRDTMCWKVDGGSSARIVEALTSAYKDCVQKT